MNETDQDIRTGKHILLWFVGLLIVLSIGGFLWSRAVQSADTAILRYEEFHEVYNTAQKLNQDLCVLGKTPANDPMFEQFSKSQRMNGARQTMNRWVAEYNAKSAMWNRALWKSDSLPYRLESNQFPCY